MEPVMYIILDSDNGLTICRDKDAAFRAMYHMKEHHDVWPIKTTYIAEESFRIFQNIDHTKGVDVSDHMQTDID